MVYSIHDIEAKFLSLPITTEARETAELFARQRLNPQKAEQIRLNTLAVWVVNDYLQLMDIPTQIEASDSWNPVLRYSDDVADLVVTGLGRLECRPVRVGEETCAIPPETWLNRIGYLVVRIDESAKVGTLLGFIGPFDPNEPVEQLQIRDLQPLDDFIDYVGRLEEAIEFLQTEDSVAVQVREVLSSRPLSEIVAQLERIYRTCEEYEWRYSGAQVLADSDVGAEVSLRGVGREEVEEAESDLEDLAESLLEKLAEIWQQ